MKTTLRAMLLSGLACTAAGSFAAIVFSDDFETDTSANYVVLRQNANNAIPQDGEAFFNVDYSAAANLEGAAAIPSSPGSSTTLGMKVIVNSDPAETTSTNAILVMPKNLAMIGDYVVEFDAWFNFEGVTATTILLGGSIEQDESTAFHQNISGVGYHFCTTPDGSSTSDYRSYKGRIAYTAATGGFFAGSLNNTNAYYTAAFPTPTFPIAGSIGKAWVHMKIERTGSDVQWTINSTPIAKVTDTDYVNGTPSILMFDPAASPRPLGTFGIIDNLKISGTLMPRVKGLWDLSQFGGTYPKNAVIDVYDETGTTLIKTITDKLDLVGSDHQYNIGLLPGKYVLKMKFSHWLRKNIAVDTTGGDVTANVSFVNGDVDLDNVVSVFDYILLSDAFDSVADQDGDPQTVDPSPTWLADADLDGDGVVSVFDYIILSDSFDISGDE